MYIYIIKNVSSTEFQGQKILVYFINFFFIIEGFGTIVFIFIVISSTFRLIYPPTFFRLLYSHNHNQLYKTHMHAKS